MMLFGRQSKASTTEAEKFFEDDFTLNLGQATRKYGDEIDQVRDCLVNKGYTLPDEWAEHDIFRFLRARKGDWGATIQMLENHLQWRDHIGANDFREAWLEKSYRQVCRQGYAGICRNGRPVYIDHLAAIDVEKVQALNYKDSDLEEMLCMQQEHTRRLKYLAVSLKTGKPVYQNTAVLDVRGRGLRIAFSKFVRDHLSLMSRVAGNNYPESCERIIVIGPPPGFETAWAVLRKLVDPRTADKVVLKRNLEDLYEYVDQGQLPQWLGGSIPDEEVLRDDHPRHPWNDPAFLEKVEDHGVVALWDTLHSDLYSQPDVGEGDESASRKKKRRRGGLVRAASAAKRTTEKTLMMPAKVARVSFSQSKKQTRRLRRALIALLRKRRKQRRTSTAETSNASTTGKLAAGDASQAEDVPSRNAARSAASSTRKSGASRGECGGRISRSRHTKDKEEVAQRSSKQGAGGDGSPTSPNAAAKLEDVEVDAEIAAYRRNEHEDIPNEHDTPTPALASPAQLQQRRFRGRSSSLVRAIHHSESRKQSSELDQAPEISDADRTRTNLQRHHSENVGENGGTRVLYLHNLKGEKVDDLLLAETYSEILRKVERTKRRAKSRTSSKDKKRSPVAGFATVSDHMGGATSSTRPQLPLPDFPEHTLEHATSRESAATLEEDEDELGSSAFTSGDDDSDFELDEAEQMLLEQLSRADLPAGTTAAVELVTSPTTATHCIKNMKRVEDDLVKNLAVDVPHAPRREGNVDFNNQPPRSIVSSCGPEDPDSIASINKATSVATTTASSLGARTSTLLEQISSGGEQPISDECEDPDHFAAPNTARGAFASATPPQSSTDHKQMEKPEGEATELSSIVPAADPAYYNSPSKVKAPPSIEETGVTPGGGGNTSTSIFGIIFGSCSYATTTNKFRPSMRSFPAPATAGGNAT